MTSEKNRAIELTEKLLKTFHLNNLERKELLKGEVKLSTIQVVIKNNLTIDGWFPINWRPTDAFSGALLENTLENNVKLYHKEEASISNYKIVETIVYTDCNKAIIKFLKITFGDQIDGIRINYSE